MQAGVNGRAWRRAWSLCEMREPSRGQIEQRGGAESGPQGNRRQGGLLRYSSPVSHVFGVKLRLQTGGCHMQRRPPESGTRRGITGIRHKARDHRHRELFASGHLAPGVAAGRRKA